jgi:hypothetical protein
MLIDLWIGHTHRTHHICCEMTQHIFIHAAAYALPFYISLQNVPIVTKMFIEVMHMASCETLEVLTIATNTVAFCNSSVYL